MLNAFLIFFFLPAGLQAADRCAESVARVLSREPLDQLSESVLVRSQQVLGKTLNRDQQRALKQAIDDTPLDAYLATEIEEQSRKLRAVGFSDEDLLKLRKQSVLTNSKLVIPKGSPVGIVQRTVNLAEFDSKALREIQRGKKLNYIASESGEIYLTSDKLDVPKDQLALISGAAKGSGSFLAREMGELGYDSSKRTVIFRPSHGFEKNELASKAMTNKISELAPGTKAVVASDSLKVPAARLMKCLDIMSAQQNGKNFVLDRVFAENLVLTTAVVGGEIAGAGRLETHEGRMVVAGDIIGTTISTALGARIGKELALRETSFTTSIGVRAGFGLGMIEMQKQVHKQVLPSSEEQLAEDLATFNQAHFFARLPVNHYFDKFLVSQLPGMVFNACQRNPALAVMVSPRAIRLYERYGSAVLYYGLRNHYVEGHREASTTVTPPPSHQAE